MLLVSVTVFFYWTGSLDLCPVLNLEDQRVTVCLVCTPVRHRWPYWEFKTPANVFLGVIKACKLPQGLIRLLEQQEMMMMMACKITKTPFRWQSFLRWCYTGWFSTSLLPSSPFMASKANRESENPPITLISPSVCFSRMTSRDSLKWRTCLRANSQQRFLAQHSIATLSRHRFE